MNRLGKPTKSLPTKEEIAMRPELVRQMLATARDRVNEDDVEHAVYIGLTEEGVPRVYHSYGKDLPLDEVAQLLEDVAAMAREQSKGRTHE